VIIRINIELDQVAALGKKFNWQKPTICPCCNNSKLWGHGFVASCFEGHSQCLWLKRYRCPSCHCIITLKPIGFWKYYQSSIHTIVKILIHRFKERLWPPWASRQRSCHWMKAFIINIKMHEFDRFADKSPLEILERCFDKQINFLSMN